MKFFKFLKFTLKSIEIPIDFYFQLVSIMINFTDNHDYRPILNSLLSPQDLKCRRLRPTCKAASCQGHAASCCGHVSASIGKARNLDGPG